MKKYRVVVAVTECFEYHVEANSDDEAEELAIELNVQGEEPDNFYVDDRSAPLVEEIKP